MRLMKKGMNQRGGASFLYVLMGVVITIGAIYAINRYQDRNHNITIHVPKVEVH